MLERSQTTDLVDIYQWRAVKASALFWYIIMTLSYPIAIPTPAKVEIAEPMITGQTKPKYRSLIYNFPTLPLSIGSFRLTPKIRSPLLNAKGSLDYID